jgi:hypothetical protein
MKGQRFRIESFGFCGQGLGSMDKGQWFKGSGFRVYGIEYRV